MSCSATRSSPAEWSAPRSPPMAPSASLVGHGWRTVGEPMIVTHSAHGDVYTLDDHPARTAYLDRLGAPMQTYTDPAAFMDFARTHPVGIRRRSGLEIRDVGSDRYVNEAWLRSNGEVPEGGVIWLMEGDVDSGLSAAERACREAVAGLGGQPPLGMLAFDCVSRRRLLGDERTKASVDHMLKSSGGAPVAGFYTWGGVRPPARHQRVLQPDPRDARGGVTCSRRPTRCPPSSSPSSSRSSGRL